MSQSNRRMPPGPEHLSTRLRCVDILQRSCGWRKVGAGSNRYTSSGLAIIGIAKARQVISARTLEVKQRNNSCFNRWLAVSKNDPGNEIVEEMVMWNQPAIRIRRFVVMAAMLFVCTIGAVAQLSTATITGTVQDKSGAVVTGA